MSNDIAWFPDYGHLMAGILSFQQWNGLNFETYDYDAFKTVVLFNCYNAVLDSQKST